MWYLVLGIAALLLTAWISYLLTTISAQRRYLAINRGEISKLRSSLIVSDEENRGLRCALNEKTARCWKLEERLDEFEHYKL